MSEIDISEEVCEAVACGLDEVANGTAEEAAAYIRALRTRVTELEKIEFFLKNDHPATYAQLMDTVKVWK